MDSLMVNLPAGILALTAVIDTILGLTVITRAYRQAYAWYFLGFVASAVVWLYGDALVLYGHAPVAASVGLVLFHAAPVFTPVFMWFFALAFPGDEKLSRTVTVLGWAYMLIVFLLVTLNMGEMSTVVISYPMNDVTPVLPGFAFYGLYIGCFFSIAFVTLLGKMLNAKGVARSQLAYTFYGLLLTVGLAMVTNIILPNLGVKGLIWLGPAFTLIGVSAIALAIVRYRLFDIRAFVVRALTYLLVMFLITAVFIAPFILFLNRLFHTALAPNQLILGVVLSVGFLYVVQYVRHYFDLLTNRIFFRGYVDPQDVLDRINSVLVRTADLNAVRESTAAILREVLHPDMLRYVLFSDPVSPDVRLARRLEAYCLDHSVASVDGDLLGSSDRELRARMREAAVDMAILLRTTNEDLGFMVLGDRRSGELYTARDKRLLTIVADEIAISLQNALRFEEIQRFNVTLQEQVEHATHRLKLSNQKLQELDEIKDDFISMASHQLRTPLTSVKGYLSMVVDGDVGKLNQRQAKMLEQAFVNSQRMAYLITDLLNISRLKTGKFVIEARPTDLAALVQQEVTQLQPAAKSKRLALTYRWPARLPLLMLDETKTRQVIMNFIDNAIYYTRPGGHITVELADKSSSIELRVTDDGIGVPKPEQHHLFTKFYRATNAQDMRPDGTGLGLFMAKKVIVAQGGSIIFSSTEGAGSTFGFLFPKAALKVTDKAAGAHPARRQSARPTA